MMESNEDDGGNDPPMEVAVEVAANTRTMSELPPLPNSESDQPGGGGEGEGEAALFGEEEEEEEEEDADRPQCYICWESTANPENPLRRDCNCSGSGGYVHLNCLVQSAEIKANQNAFDPLLRPWMKCNQCQCQYREPMASLLHRAMMSNHQGRLTKRIIAGIGSSGKMLLVYAAYFVFLSCLGCAIDFGFEEGRKQLWPLLVEKWVAAREEVRVTLFFAGAYLLFKVLWHYRVPIYRHVMRMVSALATFISAIALVEILASSVAGLVGNEQQQMAELALDMNGTETIAVAGVCVSVLAYQVRRNRHLIRQEMIEIRREGVLKALFGIAAALMLLALRIGIEYYVSDAYYKHIREEKDYKDWKAIWDEMMNSNPDFARRARQKGFISFYEYRQKIEPEVEHYVSQIREDYDANMMMLI